MSSLYTILFLIPFLAWLGVRVGICTRDFPGAPACVPWVKPVLWTLVVAALLLPQVVPALSEALRNGIWCLGCGLGGAEIVAGTRMFGRFMADSRLARVQAAGSSKMPQARQRDGDGADKRAGNARNPSEQHTQSTRSPSRPRHKH